MPVPQTIHDLLESLDTNPMMPPTILYNEGWMLRMILDVAVKRILIDPIPHNSTWYSEAQLRTPFGKSRGTQFESNTHADGVVGDFIQIQDTRSGLQLAREAKSFVVLEAKMYSPLRRGTKNAPNFDQAARNVACMAYALQQADRPPADLKTVGFYVVAPEAQISGGLFDSAMSPVSMRNRVSERISHFTGTAREDLLKWQTEWFEPLLSQMERENTLRCISWEELIETVCRNDSKIGERFRDFYQKCKQHNAPLAPAGELMGLPVRGKEYSLRSGNFKGQRVRVCSSGRINSRVHFGQCNGDAFLVPNENLVPVPDAEQTPPPADPIRDRTYSWEVEDAAPVLVRVIAVGECNSRVVRVTGENQSFKVPNHQLRLVN